MNLADVFAYMKKVYGILPQYRWKEYPSFSILENPSTQNWIAFCMAEGAEGTLAENRPCMDVSCGRVKGQLLGYSGFCPPFRMHGEQWIGILIDHMTDDAAIKYALDCAVKETSGREEEILPHVIEVQNESRQDDYADSSLPARASDSYQNNSWIPEQIKKMMNMYDYGHYSWMDKCRNFYEQGMFMKNYKDDSPYLGNIMAGRQPVYHSLNVEQLRGYFTWRKLLRKGIYEKANDAYAVIYCYELINQIGVSSAEDGYRQLENFGKRYLAEYDANRTVQHDFKAWMYDYCIVYHLPVEKLKSWQMESERQYEQSLEVLLNPESNDDDFLKAADFLSGSLKAFSNIYRKNLVERKKQLHRIWNDLRKGEDVDIAVLCFGMRDRRRWFPFQNAVYYAKRKNQPFTYQVSSMHSYLFTGNEWYEDSWRISAFDRHLLQSILHEIDRLMRKHYLSGKQIKQSDTLSWIDASIEKSIRNYEEKKREAQRPRIVINSSHLSQIREDALYTRDLLLTEEEKQAEKEEEKKEEQQPSKDNLLNENEKELLQMVLHREPIQKWLRMHHLFASTVSDEINEKLYDQFSDNVLICDGRDITVVDDYREDLIKLVKEEE